MAVVFWRIVILVVEGGVTRGSVHHAGGLSVHHVTHCSFWTVSPAWTCGQRRKHYTLLRLELCSIIGKRVCDMLVKTKSRARLALPTLQGPRPWIPGRRECRMRKAELKKRRFISGKAKLREDANEHDEDDTVSPRYQDDDPPLRKTEMCSGSFNNPSMKLLVIRDAIPDTPDLIIHSLS
ncbi:GSCOCG00001647001-RA-CDS [Cotesia congregata]|uniref:Secreted protein n=1 Tax=Cotesia congregata TaxID=51543 RepID=A0A8J2MZ83_COTCN|nr:GSCOCG00001647001-RA-CDS [Cotesia congregata]CAG5106936.1 Protein of unknown function [Cotesia congregata]